MTQRGPRFHYIILDYLCKAEGGAPRPGSEVTEVAMAPEGDFFRYNLCDATLRAVGKAFQMSR